MREKEEEKRTTRRSSLQEEKRTPRREEDATERVPPGREGAGTDRGEELSGEDKRCIKKGLAEGAWVIDQIAI